MRGAPKKKRCRKENSLIVLSDDRFAVRKLQRWETWRWPLPPHSACTSKGSIATDKEKLVRWSCMSRLHDNPISNKAQQKKHKAAANG